MRLITAQLAAIITIIGMSITLSGCEYRYRYPCQDPANWNKEECNNLECKVQGNCTDDLLGPHFFRNREQPVNEPVATITETTETEPTLEPAISSDCNCEDKPITKVKPIAMDTEGDEYEPPARTPQSMEEEVPVTMNTLVDTAAHNAATK